MSKENTSFVIELSHLLTNLSEMEEEYIRGINKAYSALKLKT